MPRQYISDIITNDEIAKWQNGNRILIYSQTGSGKSFFIKKNLYNYCKPIGKKILLLSNRNLLKNQNIVDIEGKEDVIDAKNYQTFESIISKGEKTLEELIYIYDYIVCDEIHYPFADSMFNDNTHLILPLIKNKYKDKICIYITATPQELLDYQDDYDFKYNMQFDYSYIENLYFYNKTKYSTIVHSIIKNIPSNEKILYFGSTALDCWEMSQDFDNSKFICSPSNKMGIYSDQETMKQIVYNSKFECRILFSTCILDNGINIIDKDLKHIFIEAMNPVAFIQYLGRKRIISDDDKINLYVRSYSNSNIWYIYNNFKVKLKNISDIQNSNSIDTYLKKEVDNILDIKSEVLNEAKLQHYKSQKIMLFDMYDMYDPEYYKYYICNMLNFDFNNIKQPNEEFEFETLYEILESYVGKMMFKRDKGIFKNIIFSNVFVPKKTNYRKRGFAAAKNVIAEDGLPFTLNSRQERGSENRGQRYWIVERI